MPSRVPALSATLLTLVARNSRPSTGQLPPGLGLIDVRFEYSLALGSVLGSDLPGDNITAFGLYSDVNVAGARSAGLILTKLTLPLFPNRAAWRLVFAGFGMLWASAVLAKPDLLTRDVFTMTMGRTGSGSPHSYYMMKTLARI